MLPLWRKSYRRFKMGFKIMWNCCRRHFKQIWRIWNLIVLIKVYFQNKNNPLGCSNKISSFLVVNKWFRVGLPPSKKVRFSAIKVLQNWWKVLFIYLKALFFLRYWNWCPNCFGHVGNRLGKKAKVKFKIYDFINWKQIITI